MSTNTSLQKYSAFSVEEAEKEEEKLNAESGDFMKLSVGRNVVRILPPPAAWGLTAPWVVTYQHYVKLAGLQSPIVFTCPRLLAKKPCPVCAKMDTFKSTGNPVDRQRARDLFPQRRAFANVIDRKCPEEGPKVLAFGKKIQEAFIKIRKDQDAGGDYTDPENGFDLVIERQGTSKEDTSYTVIPARRTSPLGNLEWLELQRPLAEYSRVHTPDEIRQFLSRGAEGRGGGGDRGGGATSREVFDVEPGPAKPSVQGDAEDVFGDDDTAWT